MSNDKSNQEAVNATSLSTFEIFAGLSMEDRTQIAAMMRLRTFAVGSYIISTAHQQNDVYFLISGKVRACAFSESGKQVYFEDLSAGMMFGEFAAIDDGVRSTDCIASQESQLAVLSSEYFLEVIRLFPKVQHAVLKRLVRLVRNQMQRVYEFTSFTVSQRVRFELLRIASTVPSDKSPIEIDHPPTHADLAARISTHREAVTRELKKLEATGLITWRPGQYFIHDINALSEMAST